MKILQVLLELLIAFKLKLEKFTRNIQCSQYATIVSFSSRSNALT